MTLYKARKDNIECFIQPTMISRYAELGYEVLKLEEKVIEDISQETVDIQQEMQEVESRSMIITEEKSIAISTDGGIMTDG